MDYFSLISTGLGSVSDWASGFSKFVHDLFFSECGVVNRLFGSVKSVFKAIGKWFKDFFKAIIHGHWRQAWADLKAAWEAYKKERDKLNKTIFGPLEKIRKTIHDIYDTFFHPIVSAIDDLRGIVSVIGIFNRKLAAKLDQRLWALEGKILWPITTALQRLNSLSSYFRAIVTTLGYFDRVTFLETARRDCSKLWHVLLNPLDKQAPPSTPATLPTTREIDAAYTQFITTGTGDFAEPMARAQAYYDQVLSDLS